MSNQTGNTEYKYGSVSNDEESGDALNNNFDESNLYYYKKEELTRSDKVVKAVKLAVPIIIAALFIGGLGFMLFHNFEYFYPGQSGTTHPSKKTSSSASYEPITASSSGNSHTKTVSSSSDSFEAPSIPVPAPAPAPNVGDSSCAANPACAALGLVGDSCCPTGGGVRLACCP
mmetsp:Transcript_29828/g.63868  ORF Transcript_29828/g.63868 Transcript_29828/m.63868 type:complete len:173 (-) Transcript_29828:296-814(-)|eukprot:CAMPEP_0201123280 /NCGR_PEP_ID=MMETSP0850-20130426/6692_1 /ASSEMBLY_ACC=CAM_ASM_000622 /TAXON_ID=183588 /ORGANISM="Pseudo-nitzschia fraudulenta, Strain WWA7" /LENGTH=172 /DNA_ID=CAMNT_0047390153 /DNA_START=186 /DNA_END=704 /DNA_ORIENTATION=-